MNNLIPCWYVQDPDCGWVKFHYVEMAINVAKETGAPMVYAANGKSPDQLPYVGAGGERLHGWFSLSYASFLVLPRVLMRSMPDSWQNRMAQCLEEFSERFSNLETNECCFTVRSTDEAGNMVKMPEWLKNYRYPSEADIKRVSVKS